MPGKPLTDQYCQRHLELCTYLRELRINYGYTQEEVAHEIKLSRNSISKIEHMGNFTIAHLYALADFFDIPVKLLFEEIN